ncbi:hypothetical protein WN944_018408 [Citrus x changshan-huyou]|uniref:Uncharacterized protein n=1 Tax=Citrus x changshan-huyou TaxID=2935761 RepID=A0AAP0LU12_9ROSI
MSIPIMPITPLAISVYLALRFPSGVHRSQPQASDFIDIVVRSCPVRSAPLSLSTIYDWTDWGPTSRAECGYLN